MSRVPPTALAPLAAALLLAAAPGAVRGLDNGVALTPPNGWSSWNGFKSNISEELFQRQADALVASGLAAKGYDTVIVSDTWMAK